ncbi:hypothetical protein, partial [Parabacteroides chinchillae]
SDRTDLEHSEFRWFSEVFCRSSPAGAALTFWLLLGQAKSDRTDLEHSEFRWFSEVFCRSSPAGAALTFWLLLGQAKSNKKCSPEALMHCSCHFVSVK